MGGKKKPKKNGKQKAKGDANANSDLHASASRSFNHVTAAIIATGVLGAAAIVISLFYSYRRRWGQHWMPGHRKHGSSLARPDAAMSHRSASSASSAGMSWDYDYQLRNPNPSQRLQMTFDLAREATQGSAQAPSWI
jgi:hypothetical protein